MSGGEITCGACGAINQRSAVVCDACGALLAAYITPSGADPADVPSSGEVPVASAEPLEVLKPVSAPEQEIEDRLADSAVISPPGPVSVEIEQPPRVEPIEPISFASLVEKLEEDDLVAGEPALPIQDPSEITDDGGWSRPAPATPPAMMPATHPPPQSWGARSSRTVPDQIREQLAMFGIRTVRPNVKQMRKGSPPQMIALGVAVLLGSCVSFTVGGAIDGAGCLSGLGGLGLVAAFLLIGLGASSARK